ncbi:ShdA, partial [Salmonella enterica subsp. enterica serovar Agona str. ATCC 51957]
ISGGTLVANDVNALGTGDITDNATLALNAVGDFDNAISGSGKVEKSGDDAAHAFRQQYLYRRHPYQQRHAGRQQR